MAKKLKKNTTIAKAKSLKTNVTRKFKGGGPSNFNVQNLIDPEKPVGGPAKDQFFPKYYEANKPAFDAADTQARGMGTDWYSKRRELPQFTKASDVFLKTFKEGAPAYYFPDEAYDNTSLLGGRSDDSDASAFTNQTKVEPGKVPNPAETIMHENPYATPKYEANWTKTVNEEGKDDNLNANSVYYRGMEGARPYVAYEELNHIASGIANHIPETNHAEGMQVLKNTITPKSIRKMGYGDVNRGLAKYYADKEEYLTSLNTARTSFGLDATKDYTEDEIYNILEQGRATGAAGGYNKENAQEEQMSRFYRAIGYPTGNSKFLNGKNPEDLNDEERAKYEQAKRDAVKRFLITHNAVAENEGGNTEDYGLPQAARYGGYKYGKGGTNKKNVGDPPKGLSWDEYLKTVGAKDPRFFKLTQEEVDAMFDSSGYINSDIVNRYKQTNKEGENDIRVDTYNTALKSLLDDYNKIYPKGNDGSRSLIKNAANLFTSYTTSADGKTVTLGDGASSIKLTPEEFDKFKYSKELDPKKNKEFFDAYIKNQKKWTSTDPAESGSEYRNVPTPWVDATPKYNLKGIDHPGVDDSEFNMDMRGMFRHPVFYDDKTLGKENMPLLYTTGMANEYNGSILQREEHYNPAIYPKPSYSIEGVEPVISGRPSSGASATINGQQYTVGAPTQNSNFDQFYSIPASAMPGPSAENVFVDTPDSVWMQNYKNKMNLYDVTQQNLARLKEYDPNYNVVTNYDVSDSRYDPYQKFDNNPSNTRTDMYNKRMEGYEQRYIDDPSVGFYQAGPNEEINEPCVGCGTLYGSKKSADANTTYRTYDVQYPEKGIYSKKDLERSKEHYTIKHSGNPGQSYLWKYTDDGKGGYNQELQGSVFTRDFLNDEQQSQFDSAQGGTAVVDYDPKVHKVYSDQRDVNQTIEDERGVKQREQNNLNKAQQKIEQEKTAQELWQKQQKEKQNKKIAENAEGFAMGGFGDPGKRTKELGTRTKTSDQNYVIKQDMYDEGDYNSVETKTRRSLKGFLKGAPKPETPFTRKISGEFAEGGMNKNMLNANSTTGPRSEQSWQDPGVNRFSGNTNGVNADYYFKKGGLKSKVSSKFAKLKL